MIVSVSRRTDIPAFYHEWFYDKIEKGEVMVRNPFNRKQISKIILSPETVDCFVFWTKDPADFMKNIHKISKYNYYFQFTLTAYRDDIEINVRRKNELIQTFIDLSKSIGKEKVIWRYDPIVISDIYTKEYHYKWFEIFAQKLSGYTDKCVISFVDEYKETKKNSENLGLREITQQDMIEISKILVEIGKRNNIIIESCAEAINLSEYGVEHTHCIDPKKITDITGIDYMDSKKDNMREGCQCIKSVDIGEYNSCLHNCKYCYANYNSITIYNNHKKHNVTSPLLLGELKGDEKITEHYLCKKKSKKNNISQLSFL